MKPQPRSCQIQNFDRLSFVNEGDSLEVGHTRAASSRWYGRGPPAWMAVWSRMRMYL